jgi:hypothetical protein
MAVGTPALVGGQHVVIRPEMSPHASAVLFVSNTLLLLLQLQRSDPSTAWQVRANSTVSVLSAPFSVLQFPSNSVSTLSVRYKLSRVGFVLMVPLLVLAVSFHGWVQLQRSCVSDPCNTLLLLLLVAA